ncbi:alkene reductase [Sphingomonas sp. RG327]|jgi:2,4-dienoyl-CoA reductase-like NADH-dependent reductase (Old Yellow Enzyme family)|uniref:Alkene reductase n=1 Tax=Sphingomonas anseongensis TaxID=2908207 RepID=A0ABT0RGJ4_9SPHN|nr:alkene reductase [Sphingomonas anseongensis]MCL6679361.1 alkene reductase [Sphingomonas anseongensis]
MPTLFDPVEFGAIALPNRIVMAPLTRARSDRDGVPNALMAEYYAQRASAGLIISEATGISREGLGWPNAPGLWNRAQVEGWKLVTGAVHEAGGRIVAQLWHMGRLVHPDLGGARPVSASATTAPDFAHTYEGKKPYVEARAATKDDMLRIIADYSQAAHNAIEAGFDGVQVHGANGYLVDQFLRDSSNLRTDEYGGSIENRLRFMSEVLVAIGDSIGMDRVGIRFSPNILVQGVDDSDPPRLFTAVARRLEELKVPWIELREAHRPTSAGSIPTNPVSPAMRPLYSGKIALNSDYDGPSGRARLAEGVGDAISFGRPFISNPDLVERLRAGAPLAPGDVATYYSGGSSGYVDYPTLKDAKAA